uniref:Uncharacterized protein n=1 Tax=Lepeophtheirus salmonis TaxID=72036 RepID=A0A0K2T9R4_LEPSM
MMISAKFLRGPDSAAKKELNAFCSYSLSSGTSCSSNSTISSSTSSSSPESSSSSLGYNGPFSEELPMSS